MYNLRTYAVSVSLALAVFWSPARSWAAPLTLSHGWSVNVSGGQVAAEEAIAMMERGLDDPRFLVLYTTADYGEREITATLRQRYPEARIFGMNVYRGVFTADGLHVGERGSLAMMGFAGGDLSFGVAAREVKEGADISAVTRETLAAAALDAAATPEDQPSMVLLGALKGREDEIVAELGKLIPQGVPLIGGTHCDNRFQRGHVIGNDDIVKPGIVIGLIYSRGVSVPPTTRVSSAGRNRGSSRPVKAAC